MKFARVLVCVMFALILCLATNVSAEEKKLKKSDLPTAVQKTADEQSKGATVRGYGSEIEGGKKVYEVELTINGHSRDVTIAADGAVLEIEEQVALDSLPAAVREGLQRKAGAGKILSIRTSTNICTL